MTRIAADSTARAERVALVALGIAFITLVILAFTFRGLVFLTLPLSVAAFVLGVWGAVSSERPAHRAAATVALVLGLLLLLVSIGALVADLNVSDRYDVYQRDR
jgi:hypothetical protein